MILVLLNIFIINFVILRKKNNYFFIQLKMTEYKEFNIQKTLINSLIYICIYKYNKNNLFNYLINYIKLDKI